MLALLHGVVGMAGEYPDSLVHAVGDLKSHEKGTEMNRTTRRMGPAGLVVAAALATTACPGNVHHAYRGFQGAVDRGASCAELFDQRARFSGAQYLAKIDADLAQIGCVSRDAVRH